jgi:glycosyltransferase involved in cell wall biosynthesis
MTTKLPISALVASFNEGYLLEDCLKSLDFCEEIILIDFYSSDNTLEIGNKYASKIFQTERVPFIEKIFPEFISKLKNDWFILLDPDERITENLKTDVLKFLKSPIPYTSRVTVTLYNLFKGKPLKSLKAFTPQKFLYYRLGLIITDEVHQAFKDKPGYNKYHFNLNENNYLLHYWCNSWSQLIDKHNRYSQGEGKVLYLEGKRFNSLIALYQTIKSFSYAFIQQKYYKDGLIGIGLAYHEARYTFLSWLSLKKYNKDLKVKGEILSVKEIAWGQMEKKINQFIEVSNEVVSAYEITEDLKLKKQIIIQYQRSLHRLVNDALEMNAFQLVEIAIIKASFNDEMKLYISNFLLLDRLKLIQDSGSYKLAKSITYLVNRFKK